MIGRNVWRFMVDTEDGIVARNLERAMTDKVDVVFDFYYSVRDRWYESRMYPGADGGVSIFTIDITARKKAEQRVALLSKVTLARSVYLRDVFMRCLTAFPPNSCVVRVCR